jgi:hypothetical protein
MMDVIYINKKIHHCIEHPKTNLEKKIKSERIRVNENVTKILRDPFFLGH